MAQRQFRSDDTSTWVEKWGDGSSGALTISSNTTEAPIDSSCSGTSGTTSLSATNVSFATGQLILIHQSRGTGVGAWELNKIGSYTAGTITTSYALTNTYTDSGASQAQVRVLPQYSSVTVDSTKIYTAKAWNQDVGGILAFVCNGTTTITGTIEANGEAGGTRTANGDLGGYVGGDGKPSTSGGVGGTAQCGEGTSGAPATQNTANGNGGGGAIAASTGDSRAGGGGGGHASAGGTGGQQNSATKGAAGGTSGAVELTTATFGGGGGGSATDGGADVGSGASGGGFILIISKVITVSGGLTVNGANGGTTAYGGGGASAGGSILLKCQTGTLGTTLVTSTGGTGGAGGGSGSVGGNGSVGRIHLDYSNSYTGTTNPSLDARRDAALASNTGNFFMFM